MESAAPLYLAQNIALLVSHARNWVKAHSVFSFLQLPDRPWTEPLFLLLYLLDDTVVASNVTLPSHCSVRCGWHWWGGSFGKCFQGHGDCAILWSKYGFTRRMGSSSCRCYVHFYRKLPVPVHHPSWKLSGRSKWAVPVSPGWIAGE